MLPKPQKIDLSMFFPVFNEEQNLPSLIKSAQKVCSEISRKYELIFLLHPSSTDNSKVVILDFAKSDPNIKLILRPIDRIGVGYAMLMGLRVAKYPYVFYADSDNQFNLGDIKLFLSYIDEYDLIVGMRIDRKDTKMRILYSNLYNLFVRFFFKLKIKDLDCSFRLIKKKVIDNIELRCETGAITSEIVIKALRAGFKIKQVGVTHFPRLYGSTSFFNSFLSFPKYSILKNQFQEILDLKKNK